MIHGSNFARRGYVHTRWRFRSRIIHPGSNVCYKWYVSYILLEITIINESQSTIQSPESTAPLSTMFLPRALPTNPPINNLRASFHSNIYNLHATSNSQLTRPLHTRVDNGEYLRQTGRQASLNPIPNHPPIITSDLFYLKEIPATNSLIRSIVSNVALLRALGTGID